MLYMLVVAAPEPGVEGLQSGQGGRGCCIGR